MMRIVGRLAIAVILVVVLVSLIKSIIYSSAEPETQIRWRLEEMFDGFNDGAIGPVMSGIDSDWSDSGSGRISRDELRGALLRLYLNEKHPTTHAFGMRGVLDKDSLSIQVNEDDPSRAQLSMQFAIYRMRGEEDVLYWDASLEADLLEGREGWCILRTREVNHAQRQR